MKLTIIIVLTCLLSACQQKLSFDKSYYEKISGIKLPEKYKVLETFDNSEWLTGTVLKIDSSPLKIIITDNKFDTLKTLKDVSTLFNGSFKGNKLDTRSVKNIFIIRKSKNKNNWFYLADINKEKLWMVITYPDWAGQ